MRRLFAVIAGKLHAVLACRRLEITEKLLQERPLSHCRGHRYKGGGCTCVKMEPFVLSAFFSQFYSTVRAKLGHFPFRTYGCDGFIRHRPSRTAPSNLPRPPLLRGQFGIGFEGGVQGLVPNKPLTNVVLLKWERALWQVEKDKWWIWVPDPQSAEMPAKQGKRNKTTTGLITGIGLNLSHPNNPYPLN